MAIFAAVLDDQTNLGAARLDAAAGKRAAKRGQVGRRLVDIDVDGVGLLTAAAVATGNAALWG